MTSMFKVRTRARSPRARLLAVAVAAAVLGAACGGPRAPVAIGAKRVPLDLLLGAKKALGRAPVPPGAFVLGPGGIPQFASADPNNPVPRRRPIHVQPTGCIENPTGVPKESAHVSLLAPGNATYTYRATGVLKTGGANASEEPAPDAAKVEVKDANFDILTFQGSWKMAMTLGDWGTTTTTYRNRAPGIVEHGAKQIVEGEVGATPVSGLVVVEVEPAGPAPPDEGETWPEGDPFSSIGPLRNKGVTIPPYPAEGVVDDTAQPTRGIHHGMYIERVEKAGEVPFSPPAPGLLLARYPFAVGSTFDVAGTDGITTMSYRTTVKEPRNVDACGFPVYTWTIEVTRGRVINVATREAVDFSARYQVAPVFGGLIVESETNLMATAVTPGGVVPIESTLHTKIADRPNGPVAATLNVPRVP